MLRLLWVIGRSVKASGKRKKLPRRTFRLMAAWPWVEVAASSESLLIGVLRRLRL